MASVNLGMSANEKYADMMSSSDSEIEYPEICLNDKQVKAAGLASVPVGSMMTMTATVCLCERKEDDESGMRIEFEVQEASFAMKEKPREAASILFPDD